MTEPKFKRIEGGNGYGFVLDKNKPFSPGDSYTCMSWREREDRIRDVLKAAGEPKYTIPPDIFEPDPPQFEDSAKFIEMSKEIRYWQKNSEAWHASYVDAMDSYAKTKEELRRTEKVLRERRACQCDVVIAETVNMLACATADERELIHRIVTKLMGEGRKEYGPFDLATEKRTEAELREEAADELADAMVYEVMADMVKERDE